MNEPVPAWECSTCGVLYKEEADARDCCIVMPPFRWKCPVCLSVHKAHYAAAFCCPDAAELREEMASPREEQP